jgi:hypothetical protein
VETRPSLRKDGEIYRRCLKGTDTVEELGFITEKSCSLTSVFTWDLRDDIFDNEDSVTVTQWHNLKSNADSSPFTGLEKPVGFQEFEASRISRKSAYEGGKVVSPKHRPSLTPGDTPGTHFW